MCANLLRGEKLKFCYVLVYAFCQVLILLLFLAFYAGVELCCVAFALRCIVLFLLIRWVFYSSLMSNHPEVGLQLN